MLLTSLKSFTKTQWSYSFVQRKAVFASGIPHQKNKRGEGGGNINELLG